MTSPSVDVGAVVSIDIWLLFAPFEVTHTGELDSISLSDRLLHRMTTWMLLSCAEDDSFLWD